MHPGLVRLRATATASVIRHDSPMQGASAQARSSVLVPSRWQPFRQASRCIVNARRDSAASGDRAPREAGVSGWLSSAGRQAARAARFQYLNRGSCSSAAHQRAASSGARLIAEQRRRSRPTRSRPPRRRRSAGRGRRSHAGRCAVRGPRPRSAPAHRRLPCPRRARRARPRRAPSRSTRRPARGRSRSTARPAGWPCRHARRAAGSRVRCP